MHPERGEEGLERDILTMTDEELVVELRKGLVASAGFVREVNDNTKHKMLRAVEAFDEMSARLRLSVRAPAKGEVEGLIAMLDRYSDGIQGKNELVIGLLMCNHAMIEAAAMLRRLSGGYEAGKVVPCNVCGFSDFEAIGSIEACNNCGQPRSLGTTPPLSSSEEERKPLATTAYAESLARDHERQSIVAFLRRPNTDPDGACYRFGIGTDAAHKLADAIERLDHRGGK